MIARSIGSTELGGLLRASRSEGRVGRGRYRTGPPANSPFADEVLTRPGHGSAMDLVLAPPSTPSLRIAERALPLDALAVVLRLRRRPRPLRWRAPEFVRSVDLVRTHLA